MALLMRSGQVAGSSERSLVNICRSGLSLEDLRKRMRRVFPATCHIVLLSCLQRLHSDRRPTADAQARPRAQPNDTHNLWRPTKVHQEKAGSAPALQHQGGHHHGGDDAAQRDLVLPHRLHHVLRVIDSDCTACIATERKLPVWHHRCQTGRHDTESESFSPEPNKQERTTACQEAIMVCLPSPPLPAERSRNTAPG